MTVGTPQPTRLTAARRRASVAKRALAFGSAAAFVAALLLARAGHPGNAGTASPSSGSAGTQTQETEQGDDFGFGSATVAPSTGAPQVQTSVS
jgi:hypothetical protein